MGCVGYAVVRSLELVLVDTEDLDCRNSRSFFISWKCGVSGSTIDVAAATPFHVAGGTKSV